MRMLSSIPAHHFMISHVGTVSQRVKADRLIPYFKHDVAAVWPQAAMAPVDPVERWFRHNSARRQVLFWFVGLPD